jgi:streptogrisin C
MSTTQSIRRRKSLGLAIAATVALLASPLAASGSAPDERLASGSYDSSAAARALARDYGISVAQAKTRLAHERAADLLGDRVEIERSAGRPSTAAYLYGGQQVNMSNGFICSVGFNARTSSGAYVFVTAGHCAEGFPSFSRNGVLIGGTRGYSFPTNDYASVNINNPSYWNPQGAVDMYNGYARLVYGHSQAAVGSSLCKSGRTTGWTCGTIQAYNQTVNYGGGDIVSGLVRHNACVEQGDSGGSNMSGNYAQGVSSGGQLYLSGGRYVCGQKVGRPNVSFYQPVGEALSAYGLTLVTG